jgi:phosphoribosylaminoimidazole-succinocarboxamide synthase
MTLLDWNHAYSGKVRDLYIPESESNLDDSPVLLMVASDRVSAFDHILTPGIPGKGELLTTLSLWWFEQLSEFPNHLLGTAPPAQRHRAALIEIKEEGL